jgi:hypothetical protein
VWCFLFKAVIYLLAALFGAALGIAGAEIHIRIDDRNRRRKKP